MTCKVASTAEEMYSAIQRRLDGELQDILSQGLTQADRDLLTVVKSKFSAWIELACERLTPASLSLLHTYDLKTLVSSRMRRVDRMVALVLVGTFDPVHWGHYQNVLAPLADLLKRDPGNFLPMAIMMPNGQYPPSLPGSLPGHAWKPGKACEQSRVAGVQHMSDIFAPLVQVSDIGRSHKDKGTENAFILMSQLAETAVGQIDFYLTMGSDSFNDWAATFVRFKARHGRSNITYIIFINIHKGIRVDPEKAQKVKQAGFAVVITDEQSLGLSSAEIRKSGLSLLSPRMKRIRDQFASEDTRRRALGVGLCALAGHHAVPEKPADDMLAAHQYQLEPALIEFISNPSCHRALVDRYNQILCLAGQSNRVLRIDWSEPKPGMVWLTIALTHSGKVRPSRYDVCVTTFATSEFQSTLWLQEQPYFISIIPLPSENDGALGNR